MGCWNDVTHWDGFSGGKKKLGLSQAQEQNIIVWISEQTQAFNLTNLTEQSKTVSIKEQNGAVQMKTETLSVQMKKQTWTVQSMEQTITDLLT